MQNPTTGAEETQKFETMYKDLENRRIEIENSDLENKEELMEEIRIDMYRVSKTLQMLNLFD